MKNATDESGILQDLQDVISNWSDNTFGKGPDRETALSNHLIEEAKEVLDAVKEYQLTPVFCQDKQDQIKGQLADCLILMLDIAKKYNINAFDLIEAGFNKMEVNMLREWTGPDENDMYHHKPSI